MFATWKIRIALLATMAAGMVGYASAAINWTPISEIITGLVEFLPSLLELVMGMLPIIIVIAIVTFIVGFLDFKNSAFVCQLE